MPPGLSAVRLMWRLLCTLVTTRRGRGAGRRRSKRRRRERRNWAVSCAAHQVQPFHDDPRELFVANDLHHSARLAPVLACRNSQPYRRAESSSLLRSNMAWKPLRKTPMPFLPPPRDRLQANAAYFKSAMARDGAAGGWLMFVVVNLQPNPTMSHYIIMQLNLASYHRRDHDACNKVLPAV